MKNFPEVSGLQGLNFALIAKKVAETTDSVIWLAPPTASLFAMHKKVGMKILAQHVDAGKAENSTGFLPIEMAKLSGAWGSIVNHSEHRLPLTQIKQTVKELHHNDMYALACGMTPGDCTKIARAKPDFIAIEPPELIGSGRAVSRVKPSAISDSVKAVSKVDDRIPVLCGAGIVDGSDVKKAVELGAKGVLVASGIIKATDWIAKISEMAKALRA
jgi:triosephosphate isomerase